MNITNNKPSHVFVVGVGRSGTKFLQSVLTFHPELHISTETHFFSSYLHNGFIKEARKIGDLSIDKNIDLLVDKMFNNQIFGAFWRRNILKDKARILNRFKLSDRSFKSLFQIIIEDDQLENNKTIPGEKTPSHLYHVDTLLQWFPKAKIVHIIRDPKKVLASEVYKDQKPGYPIKKGNIFYNIGLFLSIVIGWNNAVNLDVKYKKRYPENYTSIRYEDLIHDHDQVVKLLCQFLNIGFDERMLNPPVRGSSFKTPEEIAKSKKAKEYLFSKQFNWLFNFLLNSKLKKYGYKV